MTVRVRQTGIMVNVASRVDIPTFNDHYPAHEGWVSAYRYPLIFVLCVTNDTITIWKNHYQS